MNVLLLAAGEGTRLRPLTLTTPKCLAPILGTPLLQIWLALLNNSPSVSACWVNTGYLADKVEVFIGTHRPSLRYPIHIFYEERLLGTAGTLRALLPNFLEQDLLLIHADNLSWFSLADFISAHYARPLGTEITMMTFETDSPQTCGIVELDEHAVVKEFHEKVVTPPSNLANAAVYVISPSGLQRISRLERAFDFSSDVIPAFLGKIYCWQNTVYHRDIGSPAALEAAQTEFLAIAKENWGYSI